MLINKITNSISIWFKKFWGGLTYFKVKNNYNRYFIESDQNTNIFDLDIDAL